METFSIILLAPTDPKPNDVQQNSFQNQTSTTLFGLMRANSAPEPSFKNSSNSSTLKFDLANALPPQDKNSSVAGGYDSPAEYRSE